LSHLPQLLPFRRVLANLCIRLHSYLTSGYGNTSHDETSSKRARVEPVKTSTRRAERAAPVSDGACLRSDAALVRAFDLLGKRWTGVVLGTLSGGPAGFRVLARAVDGISDSMLSDRLSELGGAGLVTRTVTEGPPLSVAYALTDAGRALLPALGQITRWAEEHLPL
jgi:DNA-binding HxlR family transcriptional regulator